MIFIDNRQNNIEVTDEYVKILEQIIDYALREEKVFIDYEISVIFVDNNEIKRLNKEYRNIDKDTDVLSFPMLEYSSQKVFKDIYSDFNFTEEYLDEGRLVLGDIALSVEKAMDQSIEYGHSFIRELSYLTLHSVLHLLGYDHMEETEKSIMRKREEDILNRFKVNREL